MFDSGDFKETHTVNDPDCKVICSKTARKQVGNLTQ